VVVIKSEHHWEPVKSCGIELENLLNLRHPCIAVPIGFVFPGQLSESRELKIVGLYTEGNSLAEVISVNPVWWTATAKAKAVVGIVLGLRFAHSLGLIHGHLKSNNIIFDSDHQVQIEDFYRIVQEVGDNEKDANVDVGGFSGNEWLPKTDVRGFGSILFEIVFGHPAKLLDVSSDQVIVRPDVPVFVSEIIAASQLPNSRMRESFNNIFEILKEKDFAIVSGVDSADVLSFVNWVESFE
jgi:serine/threonine protein kinase